MTFFVLAGLDDLLFPGLLYYAVPLGHLVGRHLFFMDDLAGGVGPSHVTGGGVHEVYVFVRDCDCQIRGYQCVARLRVFQFVVVDLPAFAIGGAVERQDGLADDMDIAQRHRFEGPDGPVNVLVVLEVDGGAQFEREEAAARIEDGADVPVGVLGGLAGVPSNITSWSVHRSIVSPPASTISSKLC